MFIQRLLTACVLIPLFLAALALLPDTGWALLMLALIALALHEWAVLVKLPHAARLGYALLPTVALGALVLIPAPWAQQLLSRVLFYGILSGTLFWLLCAPAWLISRHRLSSRALLALAGLLVLLPTWCALVVLRSAAYLAHLELQQAGFWLLLAVMVTVWIADTAAYLAGRRFGRHKLAPQISPGKTWEGVLGAWLAVTLYGAAIGVFLGLAPQLVLWLVLALWSITALSIMGDLFESLIKRQADAKDSGRLLPGHGGVLDRIDGLTSSLPLVAFFVYFPVYLQVWRIV